MTGQFYFNVQTPLGNYEVGAAVRRLVQKIRSRFSVRLVLYSARQSVGSAPTIPCAVAVAMLLGTFQALQYAFLANASHI